MLCENKMTKWNFMHKTPTVLNYESYLNCARITISYREHKCFTVSSQKSSKKFNSTLKHHTQLNTWSSKETERLEDEHNFQHLTMFHKDWLKESSIACHLHTFPNEQSFVKKIGRESKRCTGVSECSSLRAPGSHRAVTIWPRLIRHSPG